MTFMVTHRPCCDHSASSTSSPQYSVCDPEAKFYYLGLPSKPRLVYRTGPVPWTEPTGLEAYRELKELCPVFGHKLNAIWNDLGPKVCDILDSIGVLWTTIDVVGFIKVGARESVGPVILWIGVAPETLCGEDAHTAAHGCLDLLKEFEITDVEVEYWESIYTRLAGSNLLKPVSIIHPTVDVRSPLTPALGLFIAAQNTPHIEGTGGLYLAEGGDSKKVLLVTACHIFFPPNKGPNVNYAHRNTGTPRHNVLLLGTKAFDNFVKSIKSTIRQHGVDTKYYNKQVEELQEREVGEDERDNEEAMKEQKRTRELLEDANETAVALDKFHDKVVKRWSQLSQRIFGHIC